MDKILYIITYFILYSFIGWVLESVYKSVLQRKLINSGFLVGPFCPIYGFGALIMLLCLNFLKGTPILVFIVSFLVLSIWEYIVGWFLEKVFKTKYWDYSKNKFNINGRVCLKNSIFWGILGVLFICLIHPIVANYIKQLPLDLLTYIDILIGFAMIIDMIASSIAVMNFDTMVKKINELGKLIKDKVFEKNNGEHIVQEMKATQAKLKIRIYKHAKRLTNAFPSMKSESITKFLNQKIDIKKLKEIIKKKNKE